MSGQTTATDGMALKSKSAADDMFKKAKKTEKEPHLKLC
jgi:hypothetical protein